MSSEQERAQGASGGDLALPPLPEAGPPYRETDPVVVQIARYVAGIHSQQNFGRAVIAATAVAGLGFVMWLVISHTMQLRLGVLGLGIGWLVGRSVRACGRGRRMRFGIVSAAITATVCTAGAVTHSIWWPGATQGRVAAATIQTLDPDGELPPVRAIGWRDWARAAFNWRALLVTVSSSIISYTCAFRPVSDDELAGLLSFY